MARVRVVSSCRRRVRRLGAGATPLEDLAVSGFDAHDIGNGDFAEQIGQRPEHDGRESVFIVVGQRRNETNFQDALYALSENRHSRRASKGLASSVPGRVSL